MEGDSLFPKDVWKLIGSNLDSYSLWCLKRTCKRFHGDVFKDHTKVKSTDVEAALLRYVGSIVQKDTTLNIAVFQTLLSDLLRNYRYYTSTSLFIMERLVSFAVKTLDSPAVLDMVRYHMCDSFPLKVIMRDVIYGGNIWNRFAAHFLSSYDIIRECFLFWSFTTKDMEYSKHFCWIVKNGISPQFIAGAFDANDKKIIHTILYDLEMFLELGFNFSISYLIKMQESVNHTMVKEIKETDEYEYRKKIIRYLVCQTGFVTDHLCSLLKTYKIHDEVVGNICGCCNYQVTKKLKVIK